MQTGWYQSLQTNIDMKRQIFLDNKTAAAHRAAEGGNTLWVMCGIWLLS